MNDSAAKAINKLPNSAKSKIIVALDVETAAEARRIVGEIGEEAGAFKIGMQLFTAAGASFVRELTGAGINVFLDLKFHDIPNTVAKASVEAARLGAWMFNIHAAGGAEMMRRTAAEVGEFCERENRRLPRIIAVTVLTSANQSVLRETGIENSVENQVVRLAALAEQCRLDGVVASPLEIEPIRQNVRDKDFLIVTPGIRNPSANETGGTKDDQKRVMSAGAAIGKGANFLVVGRPIIAAENRRAALRNIINEIGGQ